jgi:ribonuclease VapC
MAYFQDEPPAAAIQKILVDAQEGRAHIVMTVINAGEIWYIYMRRASEQIANERIQQLRMAGVEFVDADWALTKEAARLKSRHAIAYADCFAAALAKREQGRLVTGDREFTKLEKLISITWI